MKKAVPGFIKKFLTKKKIIVGIILLLVVGLLTRGFGLIKPKDVATYTVSSGTVREEIVISGEVMAEKDSAMNFGTSGKLDWVGVTEGQQVYKGQALMKLDTDVLNSAFESAKSTLRGAEANVQYVLDTVKDHKSDETYLQKTTRTTAEVAKDNAYEAYKIAEENLKNSTLYAPFNGIVAFVASVAPGENVFYTDQVVEVVDPSTIYFSVLADQTEIIKLNRESKTEIILDAYPNQTLTGKIAFLGITPQSGSTGSLYKVKIVLDQASDLVQMRVGMTGDVKFLIKEKTNVLNVPVKYVSTDKNGKYVLVGSPKNKVYVETGLEGEDDIEIVSGVKEGDVLFD
jgi:RND family efflux transporter MFP subunit